VKEKFTVKIQEAPDLSAKRAFESHHAPQQGEKSIRTTSNGIIVLFSACQAHTAQASPHDGRANVANKTSPNHKSVPSKQAGRGNDEAS
jgi:hypothetical protein